MQVEFPEGVEGKVRARRDTELSDTNTNSYMIPRPLKQELRRELHTKGFYMGESQLKELVGALSKERQLGLQLHQEPVRDACSLAMLDTYVPGFPTAQSVKVVYAIDMGGSTVRVVRLKLDGERGHKRYQRIHKLPNIDKSEKQVLMRSTTTATELFDFVAQKLADMMQEFDDHKVDNNIDVGFTFSFPCEMKNFTSATLIKWVKEWETGRDTQDPVEGRDVCALLTASLKKKKIPGTVKSFANDTVGCLLSCRLDQPKSFPECLVGVIIGTGFNICYWEPLAKNYKYVSNIINVEVGNMDKALPLTQFDAALDWNTNSLGIQKMEKCCSGAYLGELARLIVIAVFEARTPEKAWIPHSFGCPDVLSCSNDETPDCSITAKTIKNTWDEDLLLEDLNDIRIICKSVVARSAAIVTACIVAFATAAKDVSQGITVAIDGSLYLHNQQYRTLIREYLGIILGDLATKIFICPSADGSGQGSAYLACA